MTKTIALMTGGGDCPGLNAAIRAVVRAAILHYGATVIGIEDGYEGLIEKRYRLLSLDSTRGILPIGGTILGASNRTNPFKYVARGATQAVDASAAAMETLEEIGADALIVIGGDGTLTITRQFASGRVPFVGIPKTIDNDVHGTDYSIGFDTCVSTVTEAIDRLHTTAESHHRVILVEVMGRTAGWVALYAGMAGGADVILLPERPYTVEGIGRAIRRREEMGRLSTIIVVAEGVRGPSGSAVYTSRKGEVYEWKLGGVCRELESVLASVTDREVRSIILGHLQRGGSPTAFDRVLATQLAWAAIDGIMRGETDVVAGFEGGQVRLVPIERVAQGPRLLPQDHPLLRAAEQIGVYVG